MFLSKVKTEADVAREKRDHRAKVKQLVSEAACDVVWRVSFTSLRAWVDDGNYPGEIGAVRPLMMSIHELPGSGSKEERYLWSAMSSHPEQMFPAEVVQGFVEEQAVKLGHFPGVLVFSDACYVPCFARAFPGVQVRAAASSLAPALVEEMVRLEAGAKRAQPFHSATPALWGPALQPRHVAAFVAASNSLTSIVPWEVARESQVFRVRFPGGATLAESYTLPPGEIVWVNIYGNNFLQHLQMMMQKAQQEGSNKVNMSGIDPRALFGAYVFRRRCDAEAHVMCAHARNIIRGFETGRRPSYPVSPSDLPFDACPSEADKLCAVCSATGAAPCAVCGEVAYCTNGPCRSSHQAAHDLVCTARPKKKCDLKKDPLASHMTQHVLHCKYSFSHELPGDDIEAIAAGGCPIVGGIKPIFEFRDGPLPLMHDGKGNTSRPPLLELARLTRALAAVAVFIKENKFLASSPLPMVSELPVALPDLPGTGEIGGAGVGGIGGVAWVRTDPLFCAPERELREKDLEGSHAKVQMLVQAHSASLGGVNSVEQIASTAQRHADALKQQSARLMSAGGDHGHSH